MLTAGGKPSGSSMRSRRLPVIARITRRLEELEQGIMTFAGNCGLELIERRMQRRPGVEDMLAVGLNDGGIHGGIAGAEPGDVLET